MARFVNYAIIRLDAHPARDERLNLGVIIFNDGGADVRLSRRLDKVRAISGALDVNVLRENLMSLAAVDRHFIAQGLVTAPERRNALVDLGLASFSNLASFQANTANLYELAISQLLSTIVEPEPATIKIAKKRSKLLSVVKLALKRERILGKAGDDLADHRIVPEVQLAEGLVADLVLKNGIMHILETVDASSEETSNRKIVTDIALSALVFEQARINFETVGTRARLIYDATSSVENIAMPSLRAAEHQGAELINWRSNDDRMRLLVALSELAVPFEKKGKSHEARFITTNQSHFKLN